MSTVQNIVETALRKIGSRDTTNTTLLANGLTALNNMLSSWEDILIPYTINENFALTVGTGSYTIGVGGAFDTARPAKILSAYLKISYADIPLEVMTQTEYNEIPNKSSDDIPSKLFYYTSNPLGIIYFDTLPSEASDLYISSYKPITEYTALTDTILQPVEYEKAMIYNLAIDLAEENNIQCLNSVYQQAQLLKNNIMIRNSEPTPKAVLDNALLGI